jgi:hypothetical protein
MTFPKKHSDASQQLGIVRHGAFPDVKIFSEHVTP